MYGTKKKSISLCSVPVPDRGSPRARHRKLDLTRHSKECLQAQRQNQAQRQTLFAQRRATTQHKTLLRNMYNETRVLRNMLKNPNHQKNLDSVLCHISTENVTKTPNTSLQPIPDTSTPSTSDLNNASDFWQTFQHTPVSTPVKLQQHHSCPGPAQSHSKSQISSERRCPLCLRG